VPTTVFAKPFSLTELGARARALLRRSHGDIDVAMDRVTNDRQREGEFKAAESRFAAGGA
jgi:DNA-binding response OmpR family regulator